MKKFKVTLEVEVSGRLVNEDTDCQFVENMLAENLRTAGNEDFSVEASEIEAREVHVEEEEKPEGPTIEIGDIVISSIAEEKYALKGELRVVGFDGTDEDLIVVMTEDREEIRLRRDELDTVIKGDETFDL